MRERERERARERGSGKMYVHGKSLAEKTYMKIYAPAHVVFVAFVVCVAGPVNSTYSYLRRLHSSSSVTPPLVRIFPARLSSLEKSIISERRSYLSITLKH